MNTYQNIFKDGRWQEPLEKITNAQLVIVFGDRTHVKDQYSNIKAHFPEAEIVGCTTAGEILGVDLYDGTLCLTAVEFSHTKIAVTHAKVEGAVFDVGKQLAEGLEHENLKYTLVISDGQKVNGTELVEGLQAVLPKSVLITGGLAGDGTNFSETEVWHNDAVEAGQIIVCGFYGDQISVGHGSMGGWDPFGPERRITKSTANVLQTLDDQPALELYKTYLGEHANNLPSSALLFPLLIKRDTEDKSLIRTILNIDEENGSMIFAGDIPEGATAQLMRANFDRLIDGAEYAAENAFKSAAENKNPGLVLMISCVGRRLVLNQRTEEELEAVQEVFGENCAYTGFYSYGEISPIVASDSCALHNQTMTITTIFEHNA